MAPRKQGGTFMKFFQLRESLCSLFTSMMLFSSVCDAASLTPVPPPPYTRTKIQDYMTKGWTTYKSNFILSTGRVKRVENSNDTVSEGQAYAMLLAVSQSDKATFDKCFTWTEANLSRLLPGSAPYGGPDNLLAWHWTTTGGIQGNDWDAASDADEDYARALLLAYEKWGQQNYLTKATAVINDILAKEVYQPANLPNYLFLKPGNWGPDNIYGHQGIHINPSYFCPGWYRHFNTYVPDSRWQKLIDGCYYIIGAGSLSMTDPASNIATTGVGMLPDWAFVDDSGVVYYNGDSIADPTVMICSWDAFRLPWRIFMDVKISQQTEPRAQTYLNQLKTFYQNEFNAARKIFASYNYDGTAAVNYTSPVSSGIPLIFCSLNPTQIITGQTGMVQTGLAYLLKSAPTNPPQNNSFSGPDTFQDVNNKTGYFLAPGDILRYYINSWGMFGLVTTYQNP